VRELCYFASFTSTPCDGLWDRAHLISQQRLRRAGRDGLAADTRSWVPACRKHHHQFDIARTIRLKRDDYPAAFLEFAEQHGLYFDGPRRGWMIPHDYEEALNDGN
jgi:hypothetical protein